MFPPPVMQLTLLLLKVARLLKVPRLKLAVDGVGVVGVGVVMGVGVGLGVGVVLMAVVMIRVMIGVGVGVGVVIGAGVGVMQKTPKVVKSPPQLSSLGLPLPTRLKCGPVSVTRLPTPLLLFVLTVVPSLPMTPDTQLMTIR